MIRRTAAGVIIAAELFCASQVGAVEAPLLEPSVRAAVEAGRAIAARRAGYPTDDYLVASTADASKIEDDSQTIDAIMVATLFERLRFEAFLQTQEGHAFSRISVQRFVAANNNRLSIIIFAHSRSPQDNDFMEHFGQATLLDANGSRIAIANMTHGEPVLDEYAAGNGRVTDRYTGQISYTFENPARLAAYRGRSLIFSFSDDRRIDHPIVIRLAKYR